MKTQKNNRKKKTGINETRSNAREHARTHAHLPSTHVNTHPAGYLETTRVRSLVCRSAGPA